MKVELDFENIQNKEKLHHYLSEKLELPGYYGNNLDALHDCLAERGNSLTISVSHYENLEQEMGEYARTLLRVMEESGVTVEKHVREKSV